MTLLMPFLFIDVSIRCISITGDSAMLPGILTMICPQEGSLGFGPRKQSWASHSLPFQRITKKVLILQAVLFPQLPIARIVSWHYSFSTVFCWHFSNSEESEAPKPDSYLLGWPHRNSYEFLLWHLEIPQDVKASSIITTLSEAAIYRRCRSYTLRIRQQDYKFLL